MPSTPLPAEPRAPTRSRPRRSTRQPTKAAEKARTRDSLQALSKLAEIVDGRYRIISQPPVVVPLRDMPASYGYSVEELEHIVHEQFRAYRATLRDDQRHLLERFEVIDMARKVVGVGSVGTRAFIVLLQGRDQHDPLFLQVKEATDVGVGGSPAQEPLPPTGRARRPGPADDAGRQRHLPGLVQGHGGQPLPVLAAASRHEGLGNRRDDGPGDPRRVRPLLRHDLGPSPRPLRRPGGHRRVPRQEGPVRPVDRRLLERYADQNDRDYTAFRDAIRSGRLQAIEGA